MLFTLYLSVPVSPNIEAAEWMSSGGRASRNNL
jgi:hypothetical protein